MTSKSLDEVRKTTLGKLACFRERLDLCMVFNAEFLPELKTLKTKSARILSGMNTGNAIRKKSDLYAAIGDFICDETGERAKADRLARQNLAVELLETLDNDIAPRIISAAPVKKGNTP